jgi:glycine/D-amino acid oxidase-like deaminating enzyme
MLVVGGGITGTATAYYLARQGADVVLVERGDLNEQASGRNAGGLHAQVPHAMISQFGESWADGFRPALSLLLDSIGLWQRLADELDADLEVATNGGLLIAENDEQLRVLERKVAIERRFGIPSEILSGADLHRTAPYVSDRMVGAELCPLEGKANPLLAVPAFARAAAAKGAVILSHTEVLGIERAGAGFRVDTSAGTIRCERLLLCANGGIAHLASMLGVSIPIGDEPMQMSVTEPITPLVKHLVAFVGELLSLKQARAGSLLIGGGWPARFHPITGRLQVDPDSLRANLRVAVKVAPVVRHAKVIRTWAGFGNGTPDYGPVIGEIEEVPGLIVGMFPHYGFTAGPLIGRLIAALALGNPPERDLRPFAPERF